MKKKYIRPYLEIFFIETELPLALSTVDEQYEEDDELLGRGRRGTWGDLYARPSEKSSSKWGNH